MSGFGARLLLRANHEERLTAPRRALLVRPCPFRSHRLSRADHALGVPRGTLTMRRPPRAESAGREGSSRTAARSLISPAPSANRGVVISHSGHAPSMLSLAVISV